MNRFSSIFGQILHLFSKRAFFETVHATQAERGAKGFSCWDQFVAMLFCQLGQAHSLREICGGLASCFGNRSINQVIMSPFLYKGYFYTISVAEKDYVIATWPNVWTYQGIAFYAMP